jgi:hypothetical protein
MPKDPTMNVQTTEGLTMEHQIDQLLGRPQGTVREPTFSYRLEEIRAIVIQLAECWTRYQRGEQLSLSWCPGEQESPHP